MDVHPPTANLDTTWRNTAIVVGVMTFSVILFNGVAFFLQQNNPAFGIPVELTQTINGLSNKLLYFILYGVVLALILAARFFYRMSFANSAPRDTTIAIRKLQSTHILLAGLSETVCLVGFLLFMLLHLHRDFVMISVLSLILQLVHFPRKSAWEAYLASATVP